MVFYKPYSNQKEIAELFPQTDFRGTACELSALEALQTDALLIEGLVRSALHFAANRGAYTAECRLENIKDILQLLGFQKADGVFRGTVPELLAGSCCKH